MKAWHQMTMMGKVLLFVAGMGVGFGVGYKSGTMNAPKTGNEITVEMNGKVKKGSKIDFNLEGIEQKQENTKKRKRR